MSKYKRILSENSIRNTMCRAVIMKEEMLQTEGILKKIWNKVRHGHSEGSEKDRHAARDQKFADSLLDARKQREAKRPAPAEAERPAPAEAERPAPAAKKPQHMYPDAPAMSDREIEKQRENHKHGWQDYDREKYRNQPRRHDR